MCRYFFSLWSSRKKKWCLEVWVTNALDLPKETENLIVWSMDGGKDNCPRYNVIPDLALSSSFIAYTLHRPLLLLRAQCQSPHPSVKPSNKHLLCHASYYALDGFPVKTHKVSGYILLLYVPPPKQSMLPHLGRARRWRSSQHAKVAVRTPAELCCHPLGLPDPLHIHQHLLSGPIPYICVVQQTAQAVRVPALGTCPSCMLPFALTGQFRIHAPL